MDVRLSHPTHAYSVAHSCQLCTIDVVDCSKGCRSDSGSKDLYLPYITLASLS